MTGESLLFSIFGLSTCLAAIAVVLTQSVVRMAFWLIISLGSTAGLFFLAGADFVGASQLLIYVGGTVVLLVFGVMLTASGPYQQIQASSGETIVGFLIGSLFLLMVLACVGGVDWDNSVSVQAKAEAAASFQSDETGQTLRPLGLALLGTRPDLDLGAEEGSTPSNGYLLPFEIVSVHLLVVLIGAAYLARAKRRTTATAES